MEIIGNIPMRRTPDWIKAYMDFTSNSESPDQFHFLTAVSTIAGALRRQIYINQLTYTWYPNFYTIMVAPPGIAAKTTTLGIGMGLLAEVPGVHFGPEVLTWQALVKSLADAKDMIVYPGNETDPLDKQMVPMCALTCAPGEFGTFFNPHDPMMVNALISLYDSKPGAWEKRTATMGSTIPENVWLNLVGLTTPSWIADNFTRNMVGGGFASRALYAYADTKRRLVAYPRDEIIDENKYFQKRSDLVEDLKEISKLIGEVTITPEARAWGKQWYEDHWSRRPAHLVGEQFGGYMARKQTHVHKLAMILSVAQGDSLTITLDHLQVAARIITGFEHDMKIILQDFGLGDASKHVKEVATYVHIRQKVTRTDLWKYCISQMSIREFTDTLNACIQAGYIRESTEGGIVYVLAKENPRERKANEASNS